MASIASDACEAVASVVRERTSSKLHAETADEACERTAPEHDAEVAGEACERTAPEHDAETADEACEEAGEACEEADADASQQAAGECAEQQDDGEAVLDALASFRRIYSSRDESLMTFQDKEGHLHTVRSSRLA